MHRDRHTDKFPFLTEWLFYAYIQTYRYYSFFIEWPFYAYRQNYRYFSLFIGWSTYVYRHIDISPFIYWMTLYAYRQTYRYFSLFTEWPFYAYRQTQKEISLIYWITILCIEREIQTDSPYFLNDPFLHADRQINSPYLLNDLFFPYRQAHRKISLY